MKAANSRQRCRPYTLSKYACDAGGAGQPVLVDDAHNAAAGSVAEIISVGKIAAVICVMPPRPGKWRYGVWRPP